MWFRNLQVYRLDDRVISDPEVLAARLQEDAFRSCGRMDMVTTGWAPPLGRHGEQLVHAANGYLMICLRREEKLIPAGVVRQLLDDRVADIEAAEAREVYRREKMRLKEEIIVDLLPRALTRISNRFAYIDTRNAMLVVDSASAGKAELLVSQLRNTLGRLPATPLHSDKSLSACMTRWLDGAQLPDGFGLGEDCELKHPEPDGGMISCRHQDLRAAEVRNHIRGGKRAVRLAMHWRERLAFVLHEDLSIKRLRFEDIVREPEQSTGADDPASRFDLDFSIMVLELAVFLPQLLEAVGGEAGPGDRAAEKQPQTRTPVPEPEPA
ncbi:MAG: recombination-associated protein RdgC [Gammaproteobacteria bacterium]|nr:recombination-associated protein RdgC [Gammaproteobacteria bacterium]